MCILLYNHVQIEVNFNVADRMHSMLNKVILMIQEKVLQEKILCRENNLLDKLKAHGTEIAIVDDRDPYDGIRGKPDVPDYDEADKGTLYITDSESVYNMLRQQGKYVLPYQHEGNSDMSFTGALYMIEKIEEIDYETVDMMYRRLAGIPWEIFTTERCIIRETIAEDVDSFYQIYAEPEITKYMEDLYDDRDEEIAYIRNYREKVYSFYGYGMWTVLTKNGTVIGRAGISWREGFNLPELGFVIGVPWQRQGFAYEVCSAILTYARKELGFTKIQALVMQGNDKSEGLCRKLGFQYINQTICEGQIYRQMICKE